VYGLCHRGGLQRCNLAFQSDITALIGIGTSNKGYIQRNSLAIDVDDLNKVLLGHAVQFTALDAGVDKRPNPYMCDVPEGAARYITVKLAQNTLGQVVPLDLVLQYHAAQLGRQIPMPAYHPPGHALMGKMVGTAPIVVTLCRRIDECQVLGGVCRQKALFQRLGQSLGHTAAHKPAGRYGHAVLHESCGLRSSEDWFSSHTCCDPFSFS